MEFDDKYGKHYSEEKYLLLEEVENYMHQQTSVFDVPSLWECFVRTCDEYHGSCIVVQRGCYSQVNKEFWRISNTHEDAKLCHITIKNPNPRSPAS